VKIEDHDIVVLMVLRPKRQVHRVPRRREPQWPARHPSKNACETCGMIKPCWHGRACKYCNAAINTPCVSETGSYSSYPHSKRVRPGKGCGCINATQRCYLHRR